MNVSVQDILPGQAAAELMKMLVHVYDKSTICRTTAEQLKQTIEELYPIIQEVKYSGAELPADWQFQISLVSDELRSGLDLCHKIIRSSRWNAYKNLQYLRKMEKINKSITRFIQDSLQLYMLADLHGLSLSMTDGFDRIQASADSLEGTLKSRNTMTAVPNGHDKSL
ncbi:hypothetical protein SAY86_027951 [Trapa natans]|uniref:RPW8 domain-containing protein n=1 Tax=Trapa natans TaxID=22666 RepID=A0AAN7MER8_TRANT|nr:hypothetical protein SAY86_027951 [Trapa natans]